MLRKHFLVVPALVCVSVLSLLSGCAGTTPIPDGTAVTRAVLAGTLDEQMARLAAAERELDALLTRELGIDHALGMSATDAASTLPRTPRTSAPAAAAPAAEAAEAHRPRVTTAAFSAAGAASISPVEYTVPQPDAETVGAAANSLSLLHELVREALGESSLNSSTHSAEYTSGEGQNPAVSWSVQNGVASGKFTSAISDTNEAGDSVTVALEGQFEINACPDAFGAAEGAFFTTAAVTFTPHGGAARRTAVDIDMETITHTNDQAYAVDLWARLESAVRTGAPATDSDTRVPEPDSFRHDDNAYAFEFGDTGVQDRGELTADQQLDGAFSAQADDLAEQIALLLARAAEDYWRDGSCVDVVIEGEEITPMPGDKQQLWVDAVSTVDGDKITRGTVEMTRVLGDSTINPAGPQPLDEADYQFIAGQQYGRADPDFEVVTRRGIGRGGTGITIVGDVWTLEGAFDSAVYSGLSCTGIQGPWELNIAVPMIQETWSTVLTFDESLQSGFTAPPTNGGEWVHPDTRFWLVPDGDGYIMHNDPEDVALKVTRGAPDLCD